MSYTQMPPSSVKEKPLLNYPDKKIIKIHVLRNGVTPFKGIWVPVKMATATLSTLLADVSLAMKYKVFMHKDGVKSIFSADGCKITSIEELNDGQSYIAACLNEKLKSSDYRLNSRPRTAQRLTVKQSCTLDRTVTTSVNNIASKDHLPNIRRKRDSLAASTKTASQKPSNIKIPFSKSAVNIHPQSSKSLGNFSRKFGKYMCIEAIAPVTVDSMMATTGPSSRSNAAVSSRTPTCDKTVSSMRLQTTPTLRRQRRSASASIASSGTGAQKLSIFRSALKMSHPKADATQNVSRISQTLSRGGNRDKTGSSRGLQMPPTITRPGRSATSSSTTRSGTSARDLSIFRSTKKVAAAKPKAASTSETLSRGGNRDKTGCSRGLQMTPTITRPGRSATSSSTTRSGTSARDLSTFRSTTKVALGKADEKSEEATQTASCKGHPKIFSRTTAQARRAKYNVLNQWITVVRHGRRPRISYRILLDHSTTTFTSVMHKIMGTLKLSAGAKVFSETCVEITRYEDFFQDNFIFWAFPSMSITWEDFSLEIEEEDTIQRQNNILRFGLIDKVRVADLPMSVSSAYTISSIICFSNFSMFVRCSEKSSKRVLVLKIIHKMAGNKVMEICLKKYRTEVDFLSLLKHSNLSKIFLQHETKSALYIIEDYFNGGDLHTLIDVSPRILEDEAWNLIGDIMCALRYLHSMNIVHRRVCAHNLMVNINDDGSRRLKLTDFGLATRMPDKPLTDVVGLLFYMAPEMLERSYGLPVDVWGAGITLYYILMQVVPFLTHSVDETTRNILDYADVSFKYDETISTTMQSLVCGMMKRHPSSRFTTEEVCDVILKHDVDLLINLPIEDDEESVEETAAVSEPDRIDNSLSDDKWVSSSMKGNGSLSERSDILSISSILLSWRSPRECDGHSKLNEAVVLSDNGSLISEPSWKYNDSSKLIGAAGAPDTNPSTRLIADNCSLISEPSLESHQCTAEDICDLLHKTGYEFDIDLTAAEDRELLEMRRTFTILEKFPPSCSSDTSIKTTAPRQEPANISDTSLVEEWISTCNFSQFDIKLSNVVSGLEVKPSKTSELASKSSDSSIELSCRSPLSTICSCSYTCESSKLLNDSCSRVASEICGLSDREGSSCSSSTASPRGANDCCSPLQIDVSHEMSQAYYSEADSGNYEHVAAMGYRGLSDEGFHPIAVDVEVLQSDAYADST